MKLKTGSLQRRMGFLLAGMVCLVLAACYTIPETGRKAVNFLGPQEELKLGLSAFQEIKNKEKVSVDADQMARVERVGKRIAAVADQHIPHAKWEFVLFESDAANAFALPGGKVGVYTGILSITQDDDGLAAVLSHEIGHVAARHANERISEQMMVGLGAAGLSVGLGKEDKKIKRAAMIAFGLGATGLVILPHSRLQESEADRIGLIWMAKAGYPPKAAVEFWKRFREYNRKKGGSPPEFLSTHPADDRRIENLEKLLPEAEIYYQTSGKKPDSQ